MFSFLGCTFAVEQNSAPIYLANQNPFVGIFGLPKAESGTLTPKGRLGVGFLYYASNEAIKNDTSNGESIIWDGETAQYTGQFRYGLLDWLELGLDIPYIQHSGGYMDSLIRHTHDLLSIPNNRQETFDVNQIHYQINQGTNILYSMQENRNGLGDIRISAAISLMGKNPESRRFLAFRPMVKLPTGNADYLLGSGGTDFAMGLNYSDYALLERIRTVLHANAGVVYAGDSKVLSDKQRHWVGYGSLGFDWLASNMLRLKIQIDAHSAFYDSDLAQLGPSLQLLAGGTLALPSDVLLDLGMSQQMTTDATPDVGFYLFIRHLF